MLGKYTHALFSCYRVTSPLPQWPYIWIERWQAGAVVVASLSRMSGTVNLCRLLPPKISLLSLSGRSNRIQFSRIATSLKESTCDLHA